MRGQAQFLLHLLQAFFRRHPDFLQDQQALRTQGVGRRARQALAQVPQESAEFFGGQAGFLENSLEGPVAAANGPVMAVESVENVFQVMGFQAQTVEAPPAGCGWL